MNYTQIAKESIQHQVEGLKSLADSIDQNFQQVIDRILSISGRVVVSGMGKSGHIAKKIAASLASTGTPAIFIHPAEAGHGDLGMITQQDVVLLLSNSGETAELQAIIDYCIRFSIFFVGITRNGNSSLAKSAKLNLIIPKIAESFDLPAPTTSSTMMLVLGDAIAVTLMKARNFSEDDFSIFHPGGNLGARLKKVGDFMHQAAELPLIPTGSNLQDAITIMSAKQLGCMGIIDAQGSLLGVITDGDIRRNIGNINKNTSVDAIMSKTPIITTKDEYLSKVINTLYNNKITNIFIVEQNKPIGILHVHDLIKAGVI